MPSLKIKTDSLVPQSTPRTPRKTAQSESKNPFPIFGNSAVSAALTAGKPNFGARSTNSGNGRLHLKSFLG